MKLRGRKRERRETADTEAIKRHMISCCERARRVYQVWALGRLLVLASIWWMVKSRGPAAPEQTYRRTQSLSARRHGDLA